jgi:hypothetical protein
MSLRSQAGSLVYADGTTYTPPMILRSSNGWIYKPDDIRTKQEIASGRNRSFDRSNGESEASDYMVRVLREHHIGRSWEKPISATSSVSRPASVYGDSLAVSWQDTTFGWVTVSLGIVKPGAGGYSAPKDKYALTYCIHGSVLLGWLVNREVNQGSGYYSEEVRVYVDDMSNQVGEFIEDPYGVVTSALNAQNGTGSVVFGSNEHKGFDEFLSPPSFESEQFGKDDALDYDDVPQTFSTSSGNGLFYKKGIIEEVFKSEVHWDALNKLFGALEFIGFEISPQWTYGTRGYNDMSLSGMTIEIPKQGEQHEHTVYIDAHNPHVKIECGYMADETRWIDRKQREAREQMAELEDALETIEYEIEL